VTREVTLYTRRDCGLCDEALELLRPLSRTLAFSIVERDVDSDPALADRFNDVIPVVAVGESIVAHAPVDTEELRVALAKALDAS
jgi:glutaredoxin